MKETLRILFSAAFLSAVFLVASNYVNTSTNGNHNPLSSLWGSNSDHNGDEESAPADDSFQFNAQESLQPTTNQTVVNPSPSFDNKSDNALLPLPGPESQKAAVSDPYALQAPTDVVVPPINDGSSSVAPAVPVESNVVTYDPLESVAPIDPDDAVDNSAPPIPLPMNNPPAAQDESVKMNPEREAVASFIADAKQRISRGEVYQTLVFLSKYYNAPLFTPEETNQVNHLLSELSGEVIFKHPEKYFSTYTVKPGDTITVIAAQHQIPWQLVAKINGMKAPYHVNPGDKVKVVRGPFNAEIHMDKFELSLWLPIGTDSANSLYAGTFHIGLGGDCPQLQGDYIVDEKFINPDYPKFSDKPTTFGPGDSNNPYGDRLLSLVSVDDPNHAKIGIHGTNNKSYVRNSVPFGFICLGARDINDLYDILSVGSRVKIER